MKFPVNLTPEF